MSFVQIREGDWHSYELPVREDGCFEPRGCPTDTWSQFSQELAEAGMTERLVQVEDGRWAKCWVGPDEGLWSGEWVESTEAAAWLRENGYEEAARGLEDAPKQVGSATGLLEAQRQAWQRRAMAAQRDRDWEPTPTPGPSPERGGAEQ